MYLPREPRQIIVEPQSVSEITPETNVKNSGNLAALTKKKGVNWLLIGGVLIGGYYLYKYFKK